VPRRPRVPAAVRPGGLAPCPGVALCAPGARNVLARVTVVARCYSFSLFHFNFGLVDVLRRATIHFKFIFINELCRALRRATFHFKFSSGDVCRRVFRRATLNVSL
jgi:hypothetical protein